MINRSKFKKFKSTLSTFFVKNQTFKFVVNLMVKFGREENFGWNIF